MDKSNTADKLIMDGPVSTVRRYHEQTKHRFERYASGPEALDWDAQPNPFRYFEGCALVELPFSAETVTTNYPSLYKPSTVHSSEISLQSIAAFFELSFGLSAWKVYGKDRWALRCNPSSGNLHPTEAYVIFSASSVIQPGVYHYNSFEHALEQRCAFRNSQPASQTLVNGHFLLGLSSVHWREAWKYGERAFRYCQLDVGHAVAAAEFAAATLGWRVKVLSSWSDARIGSLLGLDRIDDFANAEREEPDVLLYISPEEYPKDKDIGESALFEMAQTGEWKGHANVLDRHHLYEWSIIDDVARATQNISGTELTWVPPLLPEPLELTNTQSASALIKQRRSAQAFDGMSILSKSTFFRMLDVTIPRRNLPPLSCWPVEPHLHFIVFVHRVEGLSPGLYAFVRNPSSEAKLRTSLRETFEWTRIEDCPGHMQLFKLVGANAQKAAARLSCQQAIASDGAFSLAMLAEFDTVVQNNAWKYKQLYWEAGMLGQVLYLEAEAAGFRGTGIGCYFDDPVHELLGITDTAFQDVYHFTVGMPLIDHRLVTLSPYHHLTR